MYSETHVKITKLMLLVASLLVVFTFTAMMAMANQIGVNFSEDTIGALGDYQKSLGAYEFEVDAQAQRTDAISLAANVSGQWGFDTKEGIVDRVGIKPFASYNRDDVGNTLDAGGLINFSIGGLDIAGGASFRGANPTAAALEKRFDTNDVEVEVKPADYNPNAYELPKINNINAVFNTGFEKWRIETDLTVYTPLTKRDIVPTVLISRSQTSIALLENLSLSIVVDARTYLHADGVELSFKPLGAVTYKF